jgi:hypothetical protein
MAGFVAHGATSRQPRERRCGFNPQMRKPAIHFSVIVTPNRCPSDCVWN